MKNPNRFEYTVFIFKQILKNLVSLCQAHRMTGDTGVGKKKKQTLRTKKIKCHSSYWNLPEAPSQEQHSITARSRKFGFNPFIRVPPRTLHNPKVQSQRRLSCQL